MPLAQTKPRRVTGQAAVSISTGVAPYPYAPRDLPVRFGRYVLKEVLGVGGMGTVYSARDTALHRDVALKVPHHAVDEVTLGQLFEEARAAASISHPHVCTLYDIGYQLGHAFLTMECVRGQSLDEMVSPTSPMDVRQAVAIVMRIATGLKAAHERGVIHRDLKPANILMRGPLQPVITDFGLAWRQVSSPPAKPKLIGSPAYMAPEQVRGDHAAIGPATDVYGLGTILYELITGRRPFDGAVPSIYSQVLRQSPAAPSTMVRGIDPRLDQICLRALSKSSTDRCSLDDLLRSLAEYLQVPRRRVVRDNKPIRLRQPSAPSLAQAMYRLESRAIHQDTGSSARSNVVDRSVQRVHRVRWALRRQRVGLLTGFGATVAAMAMICVAVLSSAG